MDSLVENVLFAALTSAAAWLKAVHDAGLSASELAHAVGPNRTVVGTEVFVVLELVVVVARDPVLRVSVHPLDNRRLNL